MAKSKPAPTGKAKNAKVSAKTKPVAAKAKKAPVKAAAKPKRAAVPAKKTPPKAAANKPAAKPVKAAAKPAPVKSAPPPKPPLATKKPVAASKPVERPSNQETQSGKSVSTTKSVVSTAAPIKGPKARAVAPAADSGVTMQDGRYALPTSVRIDLPNGYKPTAKEEYMSPRQLEYFRRKLSKWREELVEESRQTIESLRDEVRDVGDEAERATRETENSLELRTRDRYRKLISKIDKALKRIEEGRYGFCEETDEEIGLDRLEARPIATLSLDAQERWEHRQRQMGD